VRKANLHRVSTAPQLSAPSGAIVSAYLAHGVRATNAASVVTAIGVVKLGSGMAAAPDWAEASTEAYSASHA
jgi:hypothetical protein